MASDRIGIVRRISVSAESIGPVSGALWLARQLAVHGQVLSNRSPMIRLKDVAEKGGVSVMTVSKVLRDAPDISTQTKVRIRRLAEEMGYVPDSLAQGLRTRTTKLLGLVGSAM